MWKEDKKSTGETHLDKTVTGMQLIFCFRPINFSTLPLTLQISLFNQLERNSTAGCTLPRLLCFCLNLSHGFVARSSEGRGRQREKRDSPQSICGGLTLAMITALLFWSSFLPILNFSSQAILLLNFSERAHRAKADTFTTYAVYNKVNTHIAGFSKQSSPRIQ